MTHRAELHLARKQLKGCINLHNMPSKFWVDVCGYKTFLAHGSCMRQGTQALCVQELPWILLYRPSAFHPAVTGADWASSQPIFRGGSVLAQQLKDKRSSKTPYPALLDSEEMIPSHLCQVWECRPTVEVAGCVCVPFVQVVPAAALPVCLAVPGMDPRAHGVPQAVRSLHGVLQE